MTTPLTPQQREVVRQLLAVSSARWEFGVKLLESCRWQLEYAVDYFLRNQQLQRSRSAVTDTRQVTALFDRFAAMSPARGPNIMGAEGVLAFCNELDADPTDLIVLVIAWRFRATVMSEFKRNEFVEGFRSLGVDSIAGLREQFDDLLDDLNDPAIFAKFYTWAFDFARDNHRHVDTDMAVNFWQLMLPGRMHHLDAWIAFLEKSNQKSISRDVWTLLVEFDATIAKSLADYDPSGAWPTLFDDFVEYLRENAAASQAAGPSAS